MANLKLTLACGDYAITRALKEGTVRPDGIDLTVLTDMDSSSRHWRFLRKGEFDVAECSASGFLSALDRGLPIRAIPVFPHRRFRHGFIYVNAKAGIREPKDLIGRNVGVKSYLVTASVWVRGILAQDYGVPPESMTWFSELDEDVDFTPPEGLRISVIPDGKSVETMLAEGELDALIHPDLIEGIRTGDPRVRTLFADVKQEEITWFQRTGIFPIMHVVALKSEVVDAFPWVPTSMFTAFEAAKKTGMAKMENPRIVPLAWYRDAWEEQQRILGDDPWQYGLGQRNLENLQMLIDFSHRQGLIRRRFNADEIFIDPSQGRRRGKGTSLF